MPKPKKGARLGGSASHQKAILANLATALFEHERITTTETKAKVLRPYAEKLVTHAKAGTLAHRREVLKVIRDKDIVHKLFAQIGPSYADRDGGYTRIIKTMPRKGDNAPMAIIELVKGPTVSSEASRATRVAASQKAAAPAPAAAEPETEPAEVENTVVEVEAAAGEAAVENADAVAEGVTEESSSTAASDEVTETPTEVVEESAADEAKPEDTKES